MIKFSKQREIIKDVIVDRKDHPTATIVYDDVRKKDSNISLATVYRNLNMLASRGEIKKVSINNEEHFDPFIEEHHHFVCDKCGKIFDINLNKDIENLEKKVANNTKFQVTDFDIIMHGICDLCRKKSK